MVIDRFSGKHDFLSNFYMRGFVCGSHFHSVEHGYQAAKTLDADWFYKIRDAETPGKAKRLGQRCPIRPDWEMDKLDVMAVLLDCKFSQHTDLARRLVDTGDAELVEGNTWGDQFWGVCRGKGENHLGQLLMRLRTSLITHFPTDHKGIHHEASIRTQAT